METNNPIDVAQIRLARQLENLRFVLSRKANRLGHSITLGEACPDLIPRILDHVTDGLLARSPDLATAHPRAIIAVYTRIFTHIRERIEQQLIRTEDTGTRLADLLNAAVIDAQLTQDFRYDTRFISDEIAPRIVFHNTLNDRSLPDDETRNLTALDELVRHIATHKRELFPHPEALANQKVEFLAQLASICKNPYHHAQFITLLPAERGEFLISQITKARPLEDDKDLISELHPDSETIKWGARDYMMQQKDALHLPVNITELKAKATQYVDYTALTLVSGQDPNPQSGKSQQQLDAEFGTKLDPNGSPKVLSFADRLEQARKKQSGKDEGRSGSS